MYKQFVDDLEGFWGEYVSMLDWYIKLIKVKNIIFDFSIVLIKWFEDGEINVSYNCIDRYLVEYVKKIVLFWEGDLLEDSEEISYQ